MMVVQFRFQVFQDAFLSFVLLLLIYLLFYYYFNYYPNEFSETNVAYFSIERSVDGADYTSIHQLTAAGDTERTTTVYTWTDPNPNFVNYYRSTTICEDWFISGN